ncbi:MAG: protein translocase subunit SecDF [Flavobacteriales bacterium]|nr:protein translocase subunit SecDF [Flavobacteriales bacterium]
MQNKLAIQVFTVVFALVCLFQLSFTWVANGVRNDAEVWAKGSPEKVTHYLDSIATEPVYNLGVKNYTFREVQNNEINLGLDLKGGMNVTMEVSVVDLILNMANNSDDPVFLQAIDKAKEMQKSSDEDFVTLFGKAFAQIDPNARLASVYATLDLKDKVNYNSTNEEVLAVIREEAEDAIDRTYNILRTRIDKFGVTQPNIQRLGTSGRILVELPGIKDPKRVTDLLQKTAQLEFWETFENREIYPYLDKVNTRLRQMQLSDPADSTAKSTGDDVTDFFSEPQNPDTSVVADGTVVTVPDSLKNDSLAKSLEDKAETDALSQKNPLFELLQPPTDEKGGLAPGAIVGYVQVKDTAKVNEYLHMEELRDLLPREVKFAWNVKPVGEKQAVMTLVALKVTNRDGSPALSGDVVVDARQEFGQNRAEAEVLMIMNAQGANSWKKLTKEASSGSQKRSIAVVLDNYVYSHPYVKQEIGNGISVISGSFSIQEAEDLANVLKAGKLPAPARIVEKAVVGPSLGHKAIRDGFQSFAIAMVLVLLYMVFYYSRAGMVSNIALLANIFFIMGVLASLGAVLTLPGVAGIVLTIGMAVDANVLIYERVREELAQGKGLRLALKDGYKNAYSSIVDANVTTMLTGIVLFTFGSGPVQGFATTLIIGILTSLFSAIFITRLVFLWMMDKEQKITFYTKATKSLFSNLSINFVGKRKLYYAISGAVIAVGIFSLATKGLNLGIDFVGGRSYVVSFDKPVNASEVGNILKVPFGGSIPEVKTYGGSNQLRITTNYMIDQDGQEVDNQVQTALEEGLNSIQPNWSIESSNKVEATIADDIKQNAVWALTFSLFIIFLYILIRFKKWQFGLGALAALAHDILFVLGAFSLLDAIVPFSMEVNQAFIAATLTVIGYSINDTVVVFDRIREYLAEHKRKEMPEVINMALNSTLGRTINTSVTVFLVLISIFILGGEVIRGFSFALLIGVIVGTYSSICIATPIVVDLVKPKKEDTK